MFRKKTPPLPVDEKHADTVRRMREQGTRMHKDEADVALAGDEGLSPKMAVPVFFLVMGALYSLHALGVHREIPLQAPFIKHEWQTILFSGRPKAILGDALIDPILVAAAQALAICLAAAVPTTVTKYWRRARDNARGNIYISYWGLTVCFPFVGFFFVDFLWPILLDIVSGF